MNAQPKKALSAGELGALSPGELEKIQSISFLTSFTAQLVGLLLSWWPVVREHISLAQPVWDPQMPLQLFLESHILPWEFGLRPQKCEGQRLLVVLAMGPCRMSAPPQSPCRLLSAQPGQCCTLCSIRAQGCRDSLFLRLSLVSARQKECLTLLDQDSAGNKAQSTFWSGIASWDH